MNTLGKTENSKNNEQKNKANKIESMFNSIAKKYDLGNTILSFGTHNLWRKTLIKMHPKSSNLKVLDVCTGTGDLLPLLHKRFVGENEENVVGIDFSSDMLDQSRVKYPMFKVEKGDAQNLPYADDSFDVTSVAFGVRNYTDLELGLNELYRVLKPGGSALILEFGQPNIPVFSILYKFYSKYIMPLIGGIVTGNREAYTYLPNTAKEFPCREEFLEKLSEAGFSKNRYKSLTLGIAYAYHAKKEL